MLTPLARPALATMWCVYPHEDETIPANSTTAVEWYEVKLSARGQDYTAPADDPATLNRQGPARKWLV